MTTDVVTRFNRSMRQLDGVFLAIAPQLQNIGEVTVLELLEACDRRVKYQCSIMLSV